MNRYSRLNTLDIDLYNIYDIVRKNIRKYRHKYGYTQAQLAKGIGVSTSYECEIESPSKRKTFSLSIVYKISLFLKIPIEDFFKE